jgi:tetratricopeptide (TPR) repeat protein
VANEESEAKRQELRAQASKLLASDYYAALGVAQTATNEDVKRAFVNLAKTWHPDRIPPGLEDLRPTFTQVFARLDEARATLMDAARRLAYTTELKNPSSSRLVAAPGAMSGATLAYKKAEAFLKKNDLAQAEVHAREALQLGPMNADVQALVVWLQASKPDADNDKLRKLVVELDKILVKNDKCERAYYYRGLLRKRLDLIPQAMKDLAMCVELDPRNLEAAREVRLYRMRAEKDNPGQTTKRGKSDDEGGVGGFFKKLFGK